MVRAGVFGPAILRRSRGYAPGAVATLPVKRPMLAVGADLKNTVTLVVDGQAFVSQHIGDLEHYQAFRAFEETIRDLVSMYRSAMGRIAGRARLPSRNTLRPSTRLRCQVSQKLPCSITARTSRRCWQNAEPGRSASSASVSTAPDTETMEPSGAERFSLEAWRRVSSASRTCVRSAAWRRCRGAAPSTGGRWVSRTDGRFARPYRASVQFSPPLSAVTGTGAQAVANLHNHLRRPDCSTRPQRCSASPGKSPSKVKPPCGWNNWREPQRLTEPYPFPFVGGELDFRPLLRSVAEDRSADAIAAKLPAPSSAASPRACATASSDICADHRPGYRRAFRRSLSERTSSRRI